MPSYAPLTSRETEVLIHVIDELTSAEIAEKLRLSVRTVETHRRNIGRKVSSQTLVGQIKYAIRAGLVSGFYCSESPEVPVTT